MGALLALVGGMFVVVFAILGSWVGVIWGIAILVWAVLVLIEESEASSFESELTRIEDGVRRARLEIDRLEADALRAINDEAVRQRLNGTR